MGLGFNLGGLGCGGGVWGGSINVNWLALKRTLERPQLIEMSRDITLLMKYTPNVDMVFLVIIENYVRVPVELLKEQIGKRQLISMAWRSNARLSAYQLVSPLQFINESKRRLLRMARVIADCVVHIVVCKLAADYRLVVHP
jgi:hypothetical protein